MLYGLSVQSVASADENGFTTDFEMGLWLENYGNP